jgi:hypothetical protein
MSEDKFIVGDKGIRDWLESRGFPVGSDAAVRKMRRRIRHPIPWNRHLPRVIIRERTLAAWFAEETRAVP